MGTSVLQAMAERDGSTDFKETDCTAKCYTGVCIGISVI